MDGSHVSNWNLKDEIREYWSTRAATFDLSPGHEIFSDEERAAWQALFRRHLGTGDDRKALDLASGTGVISRLMHELDFEVTGLDFSEPMMERARDKARKLGLPLKFVAGDAESPTFPDASFDVAVTRHLVWTLPDPEAAFAEWFRVLKPGGTLLVVDADMTRRTTRQRLLQKMAALLRRFSPPAPGRGVDMAVHQSIVSRVYFSGGAHAEAVAALLGKAGFENIVIDRDLSAVHRGQGRVMPLYQRLDRASQDRYAIRASKPLQPTAAEAVSCREKALQAQT